MSRWDPRPRDRSLYLDFGDRLHKIRDKHGLTQKQLGDRIGVTPSAVSSWERGVRCPDKETIWEIVVALTGDEGWYENE